MKRRCPNLTCFNHPQHSDHDPKSVTVVRKGTFYRLSDRRRIVRYRCLSCYQQFSSSTFHPDYRQKRRDVNIKIRDLLCSGVSQRRSAKILDLNPKTVVKKFRVLSARSRFEFENDLKRFDANPITNVQFDDLETSEHTKCKPISVTLAVHKNTREIIGFQVRAMPAKGLLARIAIKKYGYRKDERRHGWNQLMKSLKTVVHAEAHFELDENPHYPKHLKKHFPKALHTRHPGARGSIGGQGELKKIRFDPLFSLNHTCAMLRANLNRLFRRTWCTTKNMTGLIDHLYLYVQFHNRELLKINAH